jgi:hypothetical protein
MHHARMRTYQHTDFTHVDRNDIFYGGHKSNEGVGSGRRRRFLDWYGFRLSTKFLYVFVKELRDSVAFSTVQTVFWTFH